MQLPVAKLNSEAKSAHACPRGRCGARSVCLRAGAYRAGGAVERRDRGRPSRSPTGTRGWCCRARGWPAITGSRWSTPRPDRLRLPRRTAGAATQYRPGRDLPGAAGDRIAQLVLTPIALAEPVEAPDARRFRPRRRRLRVQRSLRLKVPLRAQVAEQDDRALDGGRSVGRQFLDRLRQPALAVAAVGLEALAAGRGEADQGAAAVGGVGAGARRSRRLRGRRRSAPSTAAAPARRRRGR